MNVLQVAKRELKELYDPANVMFILNLQRKGRTVEMLRFKLFAKCHERKKTTTIYF
jgi:hypothetical protein